jgi:DNA-binding HxlR family transcriptional regulator
MRLQSELGSYGQFCPVAMAAEILCTRWTVLVLRELMCGSTRFNELRKGVPRMSPTLLSKRLKELEEAGIVMVEPSGQNGVSDYRLTQAGQELRPLVMSMGDWGQRWVESSLSLKNLDPSLLMWDMRRNLSPSSLPPHRYTVKFTYPELAEAQRHWWLMMEKGAVDLCSVDPGHDVDLYVRAPLRSMTSVWMGVTGLKEEIAAGQIVLEGDRMLARTVQDWLGVSVFARSPQERAGVAC